jgi:hypothetical protein
VASLRRRGVGAVIRGTRHVLAVADLQHLAPGDLSVTDPRGFATFGLAGLWSIVLGLAIRSGAPLVLVTGGLASVILGPLQWAWIGRAMIEG